MQIIIGIILIAVAWHLLKLYWTLLLSIIGGTIISTIIIQFISKIFTKNKSEQDKYFYEGVFNVLNLVAFVAVCYFSVVYFDEHGTRYDFKEHRYMSKEEYTKLQEDRAEEERIKQENEEKELKIKETAINWCNNMENCIDSFDSKWKKLFTNNDNLTSVNDIQRLYYEVLAYNKHLNESATYTIPDNISEDTKNRMEIVKQEFSTCLQNRIETLNYFMNYAKKFEETKIQDYTILIDGKKYYDMSKINIDNTRRYLNEVRRMIDK